ncbi:hypothetical protein GJ496_005249 [Pomphorhynchus laevis]|nr:hypothetical protein GJ496_005249 [Pomphorhynchus laevis]
MNILPKKRWHVRTKENVARVRRDEAKALEDEKQLQRRQLLAEKEARMNQLRNTAISKQSTMPDCINLFPVENEKNSSNKEREKEQIEKNERFEKQIGLLTYLGQSVVDSNHEMPWYAKSRKEVFGQNKISESDVAKQARRDKLLSELDPLKYMNWTSNSNANVCPQQIKETVPERNNTIDNLKAERLQRENRERERANVLLSKHYGIKVGKSKNENVEMDERKRSYNSQFNPDIAKSRKFV